MRRHFRGSKYFIRRSFDSRSLEFRGEVRWWWSEVDVRLIEDSRDEEQSSKPVSIISQLVNQSINQPTNPLPLGHKNNNNNNKPELVGCVDGGWAVLTFRVGTLLHCF